MLGFEQIRKLPPQAHALGLSAVTASAGVAAFTVFDKEAQWATGWILGMHEAHDWLLDTTDSLLATNIIMGVPFIIALYYLKLHMFRERKARRQINRKSPLIPAWSPDY
jgi:hypothetical protein